MQLSISFLIILGLLSTVHLKTKEEWKSRVIYQLLTDRFAKSYPDDHFSGCDLRSYCGGTFKGITNNLSYITGMGFNAIWISPIVENTENSYHGYHMTNLYKINPKFGTEAELIEMIETCHKNDVWVMIDVVANHVGPVGFDYQNIVPFNDASHYHDYCQIGYGDWTSNQDRVEVN
jgi:alpha-amylase